MSQDPAHGTSVGRGRRLLVSLALLVLGIGLSLPALADEARPETSAGVVPAAVCGPGDSPEKGLQGQVPLHERENGRSLLGYSCNARLVGQHQGIGASWQMAWSGRCAYYGTSSASGEGVAVLDLADPTRPRLSTRLVSPAMVGAWESLKVNERRGLLAGVTASSPAGNGPLFFEVYDVATRCEAPRLLATVPMDVVGHEGNWAPDGNTYYASSTLANKVTAIDLSDPLQPRRIATLDLPTHGLSVSADGRTGYLTGAACGNGLKVVDLSQVQQRLPQPVVRTVGEVCWKDGSTAQHTIPVTMGGKPYVIFVDEGGAAGFSACCAGAARIIDVSEPTRPRVVTRIKLAIQDPRNADAARADTAGTGIFGYQFHYCNVDRLVEPTMLACSAFQSGVRLFDIRRPRAPREIAYYNPPAQRGKNLQLRGSEHATNLVVHAGGAVLGDSSSVRGLPDLSADWCSAQIRIVPERRQLWTSCQDNGFLVLQVSDKAWPTPLSGVRQAGPASSSG